MSENHPILQSRQRTRRQVTLSTFIFSLLVVLIIGFIVGTRSRQLTTYFANLTGIGADDSKLDLSTADDVFQLLKDNYDGKVDTGALEDGAARGMTAALGDRFTVFMSEDEATEFSDSLNGRVSGIGAEIGIRNDQPTILSLIANSPAASSGLKIGDQITAVNGKSMVGKDAATTANAIRGEAGTVVKVIIKRSDGNHSFSITRAAVQDPSVAGQLKGDVAVLTIKRFDSDTGDLARRLAAKLKSEGAKKVILDLRDDGGGELDQTGAVVGLWLGEGKVVTTVRRGNTVEQTVNSNGDAIFKGMPTLILINGNTASASEIVTGALTDYQVAKTLGDKSYGKGSVQQVFPLSGGAELKVTIARWYTPHGQNINDKGFQPDIKVEQPASEVNLGHDPQLDAALKQLK